MNDADFRKLRAIQRAAESTIQQGNARIVDRQQAQETLWLVQHVYDLDEAVHELRDGAREDHAITRGRLSKAWDQGYTAGSTDTHNDGLYGYTDNPYGEPQ